MAVATCIIVGNHVSNRRRINRNCEEVLSNDNRPESNSATSRLEEPVN